MQYGINLPNFGAFGYAENVAEIARDAENAGWDGVFIWDHLTREVLVDVVDPWIALTAIAMNTERVKIGAMVTPVARRRPQKIARETASLDILSKGRLIFAVGLGGFGGAQVEWENFGEEMDLKTRAAMTDEALEIITGLWSGEPFSFEGEHYTVGESQFLPKPIQQPRIPIWVAGYYPNKRPMRRAAKWDGMFILYGKDTDSLTALRDAKSYIMEHRETDAPFDAVFTDEWVMRTMPERVALARQAEAAGATWWLDAIRPERWDVDWQAEWPYDAMREFVLQGPPKE
jgi:alkanesulfonate monooxygenase SsuD/methylene tetrahydromethanopterin reductase-like flavin-dependent oxidoreductase (luciferase family)